MKNNLRNLTARLIDIAIWLLTTALILIIYLTSQENKLLMISFVYLTTFPCLYFVLGNSYNLSIGQKIQGIKIISNKTSERISLFQSLLRELPILLVNLANLYLGIIIFIQLEDVFNQNVFIAPVELEGLYKLISYAFFPTPFIWISIDFFSRLLTGQESLIDLISSSRIKKA